ncbi:hypothetical protein [Flammeovirga aprica]|uniref:Organic solvent tolerance-like N-terminal domain-containing protein n=1 Tax=Flammeovirga aprica JL-4 TaxID=694437 RepID=A0A7X9XCN0_9BACT|nr:hypothetical protein [Flammeovirga aprica]NME71905.1 hypothetical protein [Flammeovirga aprica JL-4]
MLSKFKYKLLPILFLLSFFSTSLWAQTDFSNVMADSTVKKYYHPFTEYDSFLVDLNLFLQKGVRLGSDTIMVDFESHWENNVIDDNQKEWIYKSTKRMHKNRFKYKKHAALYYGCIMAFIDSAGHNNNQFTRFLEIADTCLISYTPKITHNFFYKSRLFLEQRLVEKSKYTTIKVMGGEYEFAHELAAEGYVSDHMIVDINTDATEGEAPKEDWFANGEGDVAQENTSDSSSDWGDDSSEDENSWEDGGSSDWGDDSSGDDSWDSGSSDWGDDSDWSSDDGSSDWGDDWSGDDSSVKMYDEGSSDSGDNGAEADLYAFSEDCNEQSSEIQNYDPGIADMPPLEGPMLHISEADLLITTKFDTALLEHTVGTFLFKSDTIVCQGGRFYWQNVNFSKDSAWCELPHFSFDTRVAYIEADHAEMYFSHYLDTIAIGAFTYRSGHFNKFPEKAIYPQFISYNNNLNWKNLPEGIEMKGGFAIKGKHTVAKAVSGAPTTITVKNDNSDLFTLKSQKSVRVKEDGKIIKTKSSLVDIYYAESDTVSHPSVNTYISVNDSTKKVYFRKTTDIYRFNPFTLSAQDVNVYADAIEWDLAEDTLDFRITGGEKIVPLIVESEDFFHPGFVSRIQGMKKFHPLMILVNHSRSHRRKCFDAGALAEELQINDEQFDESLRSMAIDGLIDYDPYSRIVKLNEKAYRYLDRYFYASSERRRKAMTSRMNFEHLSARQEKALYDRDFDNLSIAALLPKDESANVTLSLDDSSKLTLKNVPYFPISDSLNVFVTPDSAGLIIEKDRQMTFGGQFMAGTYLFRGQEFTFDYDSFLIQLTDVDSISFVLKDSITGKLKEAPNPLVDTGGTLYINKSFNKSGLLNVNGYPSFNATSDSSEKGGRIYYDRPSILNGAYDKRIVFELDTFTVDASVEHSSVSFDGILNTGGIFPSFKDEVVMDPTSGVFVLERNTNHDAPWADSKGWPIYVKKQKTDYGSKIIGKGHFDGDISLTHKGIRGNGELEYLGSEFKSEDFIFYSDSVTTQGTKGIIESDIHPKVEMHTYEMKWYVFRDSMAFKGTHEEPFTIYNSDTKFSGNLALLPTKVFGEGQVETSESNNKSQNFRFQKDGYISRHSTFDIKSNIEGSPSMHGNDIRVARNVIDNKVLIRTENSSSNSSSLTFPAVNFQTSIKEALWDIEAKNIVMSAGEALKGKFISNEPSQDSLLIEGDSANYDLASSKLNIYNVDRIRVSNLDILPDSLNQTVKISNGATIEPLTNAKIILSRYTKLHTIYNANVELVSSKTVNATGEYNYSNELGESQVIKMDRIIAKEFYNDDINDNTIQNRAYGEVQKDKPLKFVGGLEYYGKIGLVENKKVARFKGGSARLHIPGQSTQWFNYESTNDDDETDSTAHVVVDKNLFTTEENRPLITGLFYDEKNGYIYNSFMERPDGYRQEHRKLFDVEGLLKFESLDGTSNKGVFHIKPNSYFKQLESGEEEFYASIAGNWFSFDHQRNEISFRGKIDLLKPNPKEKIPTIVTSAEGVAMHEIDEITMNASLAIGPKLSTKVSSYILNDMRSNKEDAPRVLPEDYEIDSLGALNHQIVPLFNSTQYKNYLNGYDIAKLLSNYIVILDNPLVWDNNNAAFHSKGEEIKLLSAFGDDINTVVTGFIEIPKEQESGDDGDREPTDRLINIFLEGPTGIWYHIRQDKGELSIFSSNKAFMEDIKKQSDVTAGKAKQTFAFLEWYYNTYKDGSEIPSKYDSELNTAIDKEEEEFGDDFGGTEEETSGEEEEGDSIDSIPAEEEDDGDDF